jgi:hypothetical protein
MSFRRTRFGVKEPQVSEPSVRAKTNLHKRERGPGRVSDRSLAIVNPIFDPFSEAASSFSMRLRPSLPGGCSFRGPRVLHIGARSNRNNGIVVLLIIRLWDAKDQLFFVDSEFRRLPDGKQDGVLIILRPNPVDHSVRLQDILLAKHYLRVFVLAVSSQDFTDKGFTPLLR